MRIAALICIVIIAVASCDDDQSGTSTTTGAGAGGKELVEAGMDAFRQQEYDRAIEAYRQALDKQPGQAHVHNLLGMAYRFKYNQQPEPATKELEIEAFKKAVELNPRFVVALVNLGSSYYYADRKQEAARVFRQALAIMPAHPEAAQLRQMIEEVEGGDAPKGEEEGPD